MSAVCRNAAGFLWQLLRDNTVWPSVGQNLLGVPSRGTIKLDKQLYGDLAVPMPQEGGHGFRTPVAVATNPRSENVLPRAPPAASRSSDTAGHYGHLTEDQYQGFCRVVGTLSNQRGHEMRTGSWDIAGGAYGGPDSAARVVTSIDDDDPALVRSYGGFSHRVADSAPNQSWNPYPLPNTPGCTPTDTANVLGYNIEPRTVIQHHPPEHVHYE